jgi:AbrB family looped-hinge helix DNA binding protein
MATTDIPPEKLLAQSKISSKGQITLPIEIRRRLGVKEGESVKFVADKDGRTVVLPVREEEDVFAKWVGVAPLPAEYEDSVTWVRDMRDDEYEAEVTRKFLLERKLAKSRAA